ncbi:MAG TPA: hypothetical protein VI790_06370 [Candidatus Nanoarchaeia archaeon]|nr:hypothetical protein [Candidatus Nanoarchaeia archaeon]
MFLSFLGLMDILTALIALFSIYFGGLREVSYILLVILMCKGLWSMFAALH